MLRKTNIFRPKLLVTLIETSLQSRVFRMIKQELQSNPNLVSWLFLTKTGQRLKSFSFVTHKALVQIDSLTESTSLIPRMTKKTNQTHISMQEKIQIYRTEETGKIQKFKKLLIAITEQTVKRISVSCSLEVSIQVLQTKTRNTVIILAGTLQNLQSCLMKKLRVCRRLCQKFSLWIRILVVSI